MSATVSNFNQLSASMSVNNALAIYDIFMENNLEGRSLNKTPLDMPSTFKVFNQEDFDLYEIVSSYTTSARSAYYLNRKNGLYTEMPFSMGIPMNYGGMPRVRFKMVSDVITEEEPILLVPSYNLGTGKTNSAKSIEFWINLEPYAALSATNILPRTISTLTQIGGEFTINSGNAVHVNDSSAYPGMLNTVRLEKTTVSPKITFRDRFMLSGGSNYKFSLGVVNTSIDNDITLTFNFQDGSSIVEVLTPAAVVGAFTSEFSNEFQTDWRHYELNFFVSETIPPSLVTMSIGSDENILIADLQLANLDAPMESTHYENTIMEIGGENGAIVRLTADAFYLYLHGYGQIDNYQMGEWARPMYVVCVDEEQSFDIYIDTNLVLSVDKSGPKDTAGDLKGSWILFYGSPLFKYVDMSTIVIYAEPLKQDLQKYHYAISYGPSYNDVIANSEYDRIYVADGSSTNYTAKHLFPLTDKFSDGVGTGVSVGNTISIPNYKYPTITPQAATTSVVHVSDPDYSSYYMQLSPQSQSTITLNDIDINISNIFIGITTYECHDGLLFRVSSPISSLIGDFRIEQTSHVDNVYTHRIYATIQQDAVATPTVWWETSSTLNDFVIMLDLDKLSTNANINIAALFGNNDLRITFTDDVSLRYMGCATKDIMLLNDIEVEYDPIVDGIGFKFGLDILGKLNYMLYVNNGRMDIAAAGYWNILLPLANFATMVEGKPDLDFLMYFDQTQSPQFVSNLATRYMTYKEMDDYVDSALASLVEPVALGHYDDAYESFKDTEYSQMGINIFTSVPTLGRFTNPPVQTYITLDNLSRWPSKKYQTLKVERATTSGYIDFQQSPNSVLDTRWELFDGYAVRIPKNISILQYAIRYAVHLSTFSLSTIKPVFNRFEFLGVASGDSPANVVTVGTGTSIVIGTGTDVNINHPFSTHLVGEKVQSNYMSRELGFYPHADEINKKMFPINYYLSSTKDIVAISFYMYWRNETFKTDSNKQELLGTVRYFDLNGQAKFFNIIVQTDPDLRLDYQRANIILDNPAIGSIYVDANLNGQVEVARWHLVHIMINREARARFFSPDSYSVKLTQFSDKAVLNYIASHTIPVTPSNLFASRFGLTDYGVFARNSDFDEEMGIDWDDSAVTVLSSTSITSGPTPRQVVRITLP
jgi:hypothetical protein